MKTLTAINNQAASVPPSRSFALDGLRGFAAAAVIFYHAILHLDLSLAGRVLYQPIQNAESWSDVVAKAALMLMNGESAVFLFFVLSGCVLRLSIERGDQEVGPLRLGASFVLARLLRLYPPVIVCMIGFYLLSVAYREIGVSGFPVFSLSQMVENAFLTNTSMHGPSTTIQAEVLAIPFLLAAYSFRRWLGMPGLVLGLAYAIYAIDAGWLVFRLPNMHAYLFAFIFGMLVPETGLRTAFATAPRFCGWFVLAAFIGSKAFFYHSSISGLIASILIATLLVGVLYHSERDHLRQALSRPFPQFLGRISFSLYLLNVPVLYVIWAWTDQHAWFGSHAVLGGLIIGLASLLVTVPFAIASERWVERPSIKVGRAVTAWIRQRGVRHPRTPSDAEHVHV